MSLNLTFSKTAFARMEYIVDHFPDVFNSLRILLLQIDNNPLVGTTIADLRTKEEQGELTLMEKRVLDAVAHKNFPSQHSAHFMAIPGRALPPPNIAVVYYHADPRIVFAVGFIPRAKKPPEISPSP